MPEYCVTGGTGFIAAYLVKALLGEGHTVRATVRDPGDTAKVGFLWALAGAAERLKLVRADLTVDGSFDAAVAAPTASSTPRPGPRLGDGNIQVSSFPSSFPLHGTQLLLRRRHQISAAGAGGAGGRA
ncbi:unnamed protein product [Spirodela intermedia]|uniref:NAD-dependent epimerase/dehydratase domain-containing protein n=1 Tax=Spirodela intermedia TaxID=51605 RepID=A0ABN7ED69_SPIIN|nr:unnamed protein product [Spirodela intermedia]